MGKVEGRKYCNKVDSGDDNRTNEDSINMSLHWAHTGWHAVALAGKFKSGQVGTKFSYNGMED